MFNNLLNKTITANSLILIKRQLCHCTVQQWPLKKWPLFTYVMCTTSYNSCRFHLMFIMSLLWSITCGLCKIKLAHALNWVTVDTICPPLHGLSLPGTYVLILMDTKFILSRYVLRFSYIIPWLNINFIRINDRTFTSCLNSCAAMTSTAIATDQLEYYGWCNRVVLRPPFCLLKCFLQN
jgi:hypothetical protein